MKFYQLKIRHYDKLDLDTEKTSIIILELFFKTPFTQYIVYTQ